jgi:hypothetical protein
MILFFEPDYQLQSLEGLVPGLEVLPQQLPLSFKGLKHLIR